jgi:hypothetical protein
MEVNTTTKAIAKARAENPPQPHGHEGGRRVISFDSHIVDDVYNQFGGEIPRDLIERVFKCSINYFQQLQITSDKLAITVPFVGYLVASRSAMKKRLKRLRRVYEERPFFITPERKIEMECLEIKIKKANEIYKLDRSHHPFFRNIHRLMGKLFPYPYEQHETFQDKLFRPTENI